MRKWLQPAHGLEQAMWLDLRVAVCDCENVASRVRRLELSQALLPTPSAVSASNVP